MNNLEVMFWCLLVFGIIGILIILFIVGSDRLEK